MCRYNSYNKCSCQQCKKSYENEAHAHCKKAAQPKKKSYDHYYEKQVSCKQSKPWLQHKYYDDVKHNYYEQKRNKTNKCSCNYCKKHRKRKKYVCHCYEK